VKLNIRFKYWMLATTAALVLILTGLFLTMVFGKFSRLAEENAKERFSLVTQHAVAEIANLVGDVAQKVAMLSSSTRSAFVQTGDKAGQINSDDLVSPLMSSLANNARIYGHYFGLNDDEFLQVIGVRGESRIIASLQAPSGTYFAVRRITGEQEKVERWQFFDKNRQSLGERSSSTSYVPTTRPWFAGANAAGKLFLTEPYVFASTGEPGLTISAPLPGNAGVFGTDINLGDLSAFLARLSLTPNATILMLDEQSRVLVFNGRGESFENLKIPPLTALAAIDHPVLKLLGDEDIGNESRVVAFVANGSEQSFVVSTQVSGVVAARHFKVIAIAPMLDFTGPVEQARKDVLLVSGAILLLLLPLSLIGSRQVVNALTQLVWNSERIKRLDFASDPVKPSSSLYEINTLSDAQVIMHHSIKERTADLKLAQEKLARLVENGLLLSRERDRHKLLRHILFGSREIAQCAACTLFLKTERNTLAFSMRTSEDQLPPFEVPLYDPLTGEPMVGFVSSYVALKNELIIIDDVYSETRFDLSGTKDFSEQTGFRTVSMLTVPLSPRSDEVIGVLQLMNALDPETGEVIPFPVELISYVEALAAQSAVALENHNLLVAQKELMDSMIKILAGAIDAKSAYTGNHCKRVPELAVMLAEEAGQVSEGPLASFAFKTDDEWREFRVGAWLHDCGKVTTPEHVIDKATKLETIYNRIHEVRARFEVLLRDARIAQLEAIAAGVPEAEAEQLFTARQQQLFDDFLFIAQCNIGGEFMAPERIERLKTIGRQTWLRNFDDRVGLSHGELVFYDTTPQRALPAVEFLLDDKPSHIVPRTDLTAFDERYGFRMNVPKNLYNFGELYNLAVERGTLTEEERFKINEHIIQTIVMLENMPFPKNLRRVPEYAGEHHETLLGGGYPRKKTPDQLSIPSRIMAIADIFEALTATDRPYKPTKTLSECVRTLASFKNREHIDAELFDLFLTSGVYLRYAERFLKPEQIDEVDISQFLGSIHV